MTGKERCEFLRNIRKNIAEMNGLDYEPHECKHEGWCPGYCPACDAEAANLMQQLEQKEASGSPIRIDSKSIKALEDIAQIVSLDDDDDIADDDNIVGNMQYPDIPMLKGDVELPDDIDSMPPPPREDNP